MILSLEGVDGCGKTTQADLLEKAGFEVHKFPSNSEWGQRAMSEVKAELAGTNKMSKAELSALFLADFAGCMKYLEPHAKERSLVFDRYGHSFMAYSDGRWNPRGITDVIWDFIPRPDITIFLDTDMDNLLNRRAYSTAETTMITRARRAYKAMNWYDYDHVGKLTKMHEWNIMIPAHAPIERIHDDIMHVITLWGLTHN